MNLDELDRLHAAATAGEWADHADETVRWDDPMACGYDSREHHRGPPYYCTGPRCETVESAEADASFIAAAKNAWPEFSARLRAAEAEVANLRHYRDSDLAERERHVERIGTLEKRLAAEAMHAGLAECERLRGALRGMLATHDQSHSEECNAWTSRDEDVCKCDDGCAEPHCDCGSLDARNAARAALGEP